MNNSILQWLVRYFKGERLRMLGCFLLYPTNQLAITFGGALGYEAMINGLSAHDPNTFKQGILVYFLCFVISIGLISASTWTSKRLAFRLRLSIREDLLKHALSSTADLSNSMDSSEFFVRLNRDNEVVSAFLSKQLFTLISPLIVGLACIAALFIRDWIIGSLVLVCILTSLLCQHHYSHKFHACLQVRHHALDKLYAFIGESLSAALITRVFFAKQRMKACADNLAEEVYHQDKIHTQLKTQHHLFVKFFSATATILPMIVSILFVALGRLSLGEIMYITQLSRSAITAADQLSMMLPDLQSVRISAKHLRDMLTQEPAEISPQAEMAFPFRTRKGELLIEQLNVRFPGKHVLRDLNLHIKAGQKVAIVGGSGQGKSTLLKAILSFVPYEGSIEINGEPNSPLSPFKRNIAYISQEPFILEGSIWENIQIGDLNASREQVLRAAKLACVDAFVQDLPEGYETILNESNSLSRGQYQRICFARAILHDAPIWLLDEFTSALDPQTSAELLQHCAELTREKTVLFITHTPDELNFLDKIYLLQNGVLQN